MRKGIDAQIEIHTPLFESKLLDSLAFMEFLTALEVDLDVNVPDHKMSIQFFQTPDCIATHFFSTNNSPS